MSNLKDREYFINKNEKYIFVYHNPDSESGGQIVKNVIYGTDKVMSLIDKSNDVFEFLDIFESESTQTLLDKETQEYEDWVDYLSAHKQEGWDFTLKIVRSQIKEPKTVLNWLNQQIIHLRGLLNG